MKKIAYILLIVFVTTSCREKDTCKKTKDDKLLASATQENAKTVDATNSFDIPKEDAGLLSIENNKGISEEDSIIYMARNSFRDLELNLVDISKEQFNTYLTNDIKNNTKECGFSKLNLKEESDCDEICETYLSEINSNKKLHLPCDYDAGILGVSFSENCNKLMVCSSYDGPDFDDYYENRAEIYVFEINGTDGLNSLQASFKFTTKEWSIENYIWISDDKIGLKLYSEQASGDGSQLVYNYFRIAIPDIN